MLYLTVSCLLDYSLMAFEEMYYCGYKTSSQAAHIKLKLALIYLILQSSLVVWSKVVELDPWCFSPTLMN